MGSISGSHLRNSEDLLRRLKGISMRCMKMASYDVKSLFTQIPIDGALEAVWRVVINVDEEELPLPRGDFMKLVSMCVNFGSFTFEGEEFLQHSGLAMGSPLSAVAACLFMEVQEKDHYSHMVGRRAIWLSYKRWLHHGHLACRAARFASGQSIISVTVTSAFSAN
ncbi:uncharacterized protein LOC143024033 [Oratosquilla oratoria]|uniref:uncharacterized protein LOC143024033 n=1 Tax=Oratosquilla oratoria TaxID=337810 RepID=UPI003F7597C9